MIKRKVLFKIYTAVTLIGGLIACNSDDETKVASNGKITTCTRTIELTEKQKDAISKNNDFAFNLYHAISQKEMLRGKSNVISPLSLTFALGMLNTGATGQTSKELQNLLGFDDCDVADINVLCNQLTKEMPKVDDFVSFGIANFMAIDKSFEVEEQFKEDLNLYYDAEVASLPFGTKEAVDFINSWASWHTQGLIDHLVDNLSGEMAILNAVYLNAPWSEVFASKDTSYEPFEKENGQKISLPMMNGKFVSTSYAKTNNYKALRLRYGTNNNWALYVLLPNKDTTTDAVIKELNNASWSMMLQGMTEQALNVKLPRFKTETTIKLESILEKMGAPSMFKPRQELSRISSNYKNLFVDVIQQNVAIDVNEEGTTAAAVTIIKSDIGINNPNYIDFHVNRPFVYIVQEASSGAIFFIGTYYGK